MLKFQLKAISFNFKILKMIKIPILISLSKMIRSTALLLVLTKNSLSFKERLKL